MDFGELLSLSNKGLPIAYDFEKSALEGVDAVNHAWIETLHLGITQFETLDSVVLLLEKEKHKDSFVLLRSVFESHFFLLLMIHGKKFREARRFRVIPNAGEEAETARDETLKKWRASIKSGDPQYAKIVNLGTEGNDIILATVEDEGLYDENDVERKGPIIPRYYFAFDEYDPETRFVAELPSISEGDPYPKITNELLKQQKMIYNQYFYVPHIERNLKINNLVDDEQQDRFDVHYSFLSMFVHPTKPGIVRREKTTHMLPYTPKVMKFVRRSLILFYVCKLQSMLLQTLVQYFQKINTKKDFKPFEEQVKIRQEATKEFWFIFDEPTEFDLKQSENIRKTVASVGNVKPTEAIVYYRDPSKRLADYLMFKGIIHP